MAQRGLVPPELRTTNALCITQLPVGQGARHRRRQAQLLDGKTPDAGRDYPRFASPLGYAGTFRLLRVTLSLPAFNRCLRGANKPERK